MLCIRVLILICMSLGSLAWSSGESKKYFCKLRLSNSLFAPRMYLGHGPVKKGEPIEFVQPIVRTLNKDFELVSFRVESTKAYDDLDPSTDQAAFDDLARDYINF